ncbi:hypothetical protein TIFTF001_040525 [Ficus carica]|uniref:Uncharacterized protein n=1 Tax=Ficus carica TaxID=3494 RepID=A0AA88CP24_FICCA|nr:hypothetical protein TIFTF001_040525 [Ficus carica]
MAERTGKASTLVTVSAMLDDSPTASQAALNIFKRLSIAVDMAHILKEERFKIDDTWNRKTEKSQQLAGRTSKKGSKNKRERKKESEIVPVKKIVEEDEEFQT